MQQPIREQIAYADEQLQETKEILETSESFKRKQALVQRRFELMRLLSDVPEDEARLKVAIE